MVDNTKKSNQKTTSSHITQRDRTRPSSTPKISKATDRSGERSTSRRYGRSPQRSRPRSVVTKVESPKQDAESKRKVTFGLPSSPRHARRRSDSSYYSRRQSSSYSRTSRAQAREHSWN